MMDAVRREPFTVCITFEGDTSLIRDFELNLAQRGAIVLKKRMEDAEFDGERCAYITFPGRETARLRPDCPAYAQVRVLLFDGEELHSEAREVNVVDVLGA